MNRLKDLNDDFIQNKKESIINLIDALGLREDTLTQSNITLLTSIPPRSFRMICEDSYYLYLRDELDGVIIGSVKGYHFETNADVIWNNLISKKNNALSQLFNVYHLAKKVKNNDNMTIEDFMKC